VDQGDYERVRSLSGSSSPDQLQRNYTVGQAMRRAKAGHKRQNT
jgi:hypothetical protein